MFWKLDQKNNICKLGTENYEEILAKMDAAEIAARDYVESKVGRLNF